MLFIGDEVVYQGKRVKVIGFENGLVRISGHNLYLLVRDYEVKKVKGKNSKLVTC